MNIDALFVEYAQKYISEHDPRAWDTIIHIEGKLNDKNVPFNMKGRPFRVVAIDQYLTQKRIADPVMVWIITEADRSSTTLLLPSDY